MEATYINPSPFVWVGAFMFFIFLLQVMTSAWIYSHNWFLSTVISGCLFLILTFGVDSDSTKDFVAPFYMSLFIVYAIGMKYVMKSRFFDIKNQSHKKLKEFIIEKSEITLFDRFLLKLGPFLFISIWLYALYVLAVNYFL